MSYTSLRQLSLILFAVFLWNSSVIGQEITVQNFQDLLDFAKSQSSEKQIWELRRLKEETALRESRSLLLPSLKAYGTWDDYLQLPVQLIPSEAFGGEPGTFTELKFGTQYQLNLGLEASLPLINFELWNQVKSERLRVTFAKAELATQEQIWSEQLARAYYLSLLHQESLELAQKRASISDSIFQVAKAQFEIGELEPLPFQRIQASSLAAKNQVISQDRKLKTAIQSLIRLVGADDGLEFYLAEKLSLGDLDLIDLNYSLEQIPEWKMAEGKVEHYAQQLASQKKGHLPTLSATGRFYQQSLSNDFNLANSTAFEVGIVGLSLEWQLFRGGQQRLKTKSADLDWQIAKKQLEVTTQTLQQEKLDLEASILENLSLSTGYIPLLELFQDNYHLAGIQWLEGEISADELLQVEQEWLDQQNNYLNILSELSISNALLAIRNQSYSEHP